MVKVELGPGLALGELLVGEAALAARGLAAAAARGRVEAVRLPRPVTRHAPQQPGGVRVSGWSGGRAGGVFFIYCNRMEAVRGGEKEHDGVLLPQ